MIVSCASAKSAPPGPSGVVVAHPGRQHAYETVRGAQAAGLLRAFATGVYFSEGSWLRRSVDWLGWLSRSDAVSTAISQRFDTSIEPRAVVSFPLPSLIARVARPTRFAREVDRWADRRCDARIARWLTTLDPPPAVVHGFEGGALSTFRRAMELGCKIVLDVPNAHERLDVVLREEGGRSAPIAVTTRVRAERALADRLVAPSAFVRECLVEHGVAEERIVVVPYGVDATRFQPSHERSDELFRVLFVGFVSHRKGIRYLVDAWNRLSLPQAELLVVGGADDYGRSQVARAVSCRWIGNVARGVVHNHFARSDVFVLPSLCEGSALVTYEAMASALPVITTVSSGSVVRDGTDGYVVAPRDVDALCERLEALWRDREVARRLGWNGRSLVQSEYTWDRYYERIVGVYRSLS